MISLLHHFLVGLVRFLNQLVVFVLCGLVHRLGFLVEIVKLVEESRGNLVEAPKHGYDDYNVEQ
jgi:hypothetical protein